MSELFDFSQAISKFIKENKCEEALVWFKENKTKFTDEQIRDNVYVISAMLKALRCTNNIDNAFVFLKKYNIIIGENSSEIVLIPYGWLLYSKFKAENNHQEFSHIETDFFDEEEPLEIKNHDYFQKSEIIKIIEEFIPLILKFTNKYAYACFSSLFNLVLKSEKSKINPNWMYINNFCSLVNPDQLSNECIQIEVQRKGEKKSMELASDRENWYAFKSKALFKLGKYQDCYNLSKIALESFEKFHYSNDIWFARRIALSKKTFGNSDDTISDLLLILKKKKEWFIQKELAELFFEKGDLENALNYSICAVINFGDIEYKVELLFLMGEILKEKNELELSFKHFSLSHLIRLNKKWKVPPKLVFALDSFSQEKIKIEKLDELLKDLKIFWNKNHGIDNNPNILKYTGIVAKILHNNEKGLDGFIHYDKNKSIYFTIGIRDKIVAEIKLYDKIEFVILPVKEDKKEKARILRKI